MKTPRIEAFDPKAARELGSPMDNLPRIEKPEAAPAAVPEKPKRAKRKPTVASPTLPQAVELAGAAEAEAADKSKNVRFLTFLQPYLDGKAETIMSYRVPQAMMDGLDDLQAELWRQFRTKRTKGALVATAVAYLIWDFQQRGTDSILYKHLVEEAGKPSVRK